MLTCLRAHVLYLFAIRCCAPLPLPRYDVIALIADLDRNRVVVKAEAVAAIVDHALPSGAAASACMR